MTGYLVPQPPFVSPKAAVVAKTAAATLTVDEVNGKQITNTGATAAVALTLPAASDAAGCSFRVQLTVAQVVQCLPGAAGKVFLGGSGVVAKYLNIAGVIGNYADITSDGVDWLVTAYNGVVTKEA